MPLVADIETDSLDPTVVWLIGVWDLDTDTYTDYHGDTLEEGLRVLLAADLVAFHNGNTYDVIHLERLHGVRFDMSRVLDTLLMSRLLCPEREEHSLDSWGVTFGLPKGSFKDFAGGLTEEMRIYCRRDVELTVRVLNHLLALVPKYADAFALEQDVAAIIMAQHRHGFQLDEPRARSLLDGFNVEIDALRASLREEFPDRPLPTRKTTVGRKETEEVAQGAIYTPVRWDVLNATSRPQMITRLMERGWLPTVFTDNKNISLNNAVLKSMVGDFPVAEQVERLYDLSKQASQLNNWFKYIRAGRIHGVVSTCGARTGRMTHSKPNSANVDTREALRSLWIATPGKVLVDCDAEGLEARGIAHFLADRDGGALAVMVDTGDKKLGTDIHTSNQKAIGLYSRDAAKTFLYAMVYGSGVEPLGEIVFEDAVQAGKQGNLGKVNLRDLGSQAKRSLMANITGLSEFEAEIKQQYYRTGYLIGIDGRKIVPAEDYTCLNTMIQSAGAVIMKRALVIFDGLCREAGLNIAHVGNVHDEFIVECLPDIAPRVAELAQDAIHAAGLYYNLKCPLRGEAHIGSNWYEVH